MARRRLEVSELQTAVSFSAHRPSQEIPEDARRKGPCVSLLAAPKWLRCGLYSLGISTMNGSTALLLFSVICGQDQPETVTGNFRLAPPQDGALLADSLRGLRVAPAAFEDSAEASSAGETVQDGPAAIPEFGAEGSMRWTIHGGWGIDVKGSNQEVQGGVGLQYFIIDGFAFAPELNLWGFFQTGSNAFGGSLDLMFQWHFIREPKWSIYGDFGIGLLGTTANVPIDGSEFNFTPQAGVGVTWDIGNNNRWYAGVRWHHISNASLYENNPGRDSVLIYTGINFPF